MAKSENKIGFIGAGHIAQAIILGLLKSNSSTNANIFVSSPNILKLQKNEALKTTNLMSDNCKVTQESDIIFLCVKPGIVLGIIDEIKNVLGEKILISVAAGVLIEKIEHKLGTNAKIIRVMPNIPVSVNQGVVGIYGNKNITDNDIKSVETLLANLGIVMQLRKEDDLDILTLISGCGPGIAAYFIEMLSGSAQKFGLPESESLALAKQVFRGTLDYLDQKNQIPAGLIEAVATKGGVTRAIIDGMEKDNLKTLFHFSLDNGFNRVKEIKQKLN